MGVYVGCIYRLALVSVGEICYTGIKGGVGLETAKIDSITRLRIHSDGTGVRSVVFLCGCPLNCFWCCNPETRHGSHNRELTAEALYDYVKGDIPYFQASEGGITFSGGEPLLWTEFLRTFILEYCQGFSVDMETSLHTSRQNLDTLIPLIGQWNVDFKVWDSEKHCSFTGQPNTLILDNLKYLASQIPTERILVTYPVIPGYNDDDVNLKAMAGFLRENGISRVEPHPYRKVCEEKHRRLGLSSPELEPISEARFRSVLERLRQYGMTIVMRRAPFGKEKCSYLKTLRRQICEREKLDVEIAECSQEEACIGTCPRCEYELKRIANALEERK